MILYSVATASSTWRRLARCSGVTRGLWARKLMRGGTTCRKVGRCAARADTNNEGSNPGSTTSGRRRL